MSVGYQREYEVEAIYHFTKMALLFARLFPENEKLKSYAKQAYIKFVQLATAEIRDVKNNQSILDGRLLDCSECERAHGKKPCMTKGRAWANRLCVYNTYECNRAAIQKHFGEQGLQMFDYMDRWITRKTEEMKNAKESAASAE